MDFENPIFKLIIFAATIYTLFFIGFSYLRFEKFLTEKEIVITVINKEKFGTEESKYLIFKPDEVFDNSNKFYRRKTNADLIYKKLERCNLSRESSRLLLTKYSATQKYN
jgi:hypothetical protein